jgi:hypothetical protein
MRLRLLIILLGLSLLPAGHLFAQQKPPADSLRFTFEPTFILPRSGTARPLYGVTYSVVLTKDSLLADLPYEGRAWSIVNVNPQYQGIRFVARRFTTKSRTTRRGMRNVTVFIKDGGDIYRMAFSIPRSGEATLQVYSDRRDMVGFSGNIRYER